MIAGQQINGVRRVVTGLADDGRSCVLADEIVPMAGLGTMLWQFDPAKDVAWGKDIADEAVPPIEPAPGGSHAMVVSLPPAGTEIEAPDIAGIDADGFHVTRTLDYILVLTGEIELALDHEKLTLKPGDMVIQQATNHAWYNTTSEPASFLAVLTALKPA